MTLPVRKGIPLWFALMVLTAVIAATLPAQAAPLSGAIFTTDPTGSIVNANVQYQSKCDVYLDGGPPPGAPQGAAGLPDGSYYVQVKEKTSDGGRLTPFTCKAVTCTSLPIPEKIKLPAGL
jgi:hypothetical protein